ncbi:MAG: ferredoxin [Mycobacterium sp.]|nr:ferredoxin [Mycobacterium sp.]
MTVRPDNRLADMPMVPVTCRACGAKVLARKGSWQQTSVQWDTQSAGRCEERQRSERLPGRIFLACGQLRESISAAAAAGSLHVVGDELDVAP